MRLAFSIIVFVSFSIPPCFAEEFGGQHVAGGKKVQKNKVVPATDPPVEPSGDDPVVDSSGDDGKPVLSEVVAKDDGKIKDAGKVASESTKQLKDAGSNGNSVRSNADQIISATNGLNAANAAIDKRLDELSETYNVEEAREALKWQAAAALMQGLGQGPQAGDTPESQRQRSEAAQRGVASETPSAPTFVTPNIEGLSSLPSGSRAEIADLLSGGEGSLNELEQAVNDSVTVDDSADASAAAQLERSAGVPLVRTPLSSGEGDPAAGSLVFDENAKHPEGESAVQAGEEAAKGGAVVQAGADKSGEPNLKDLLAQVGEKINELDDDISRDPTSRYGSALGASGGSGNDLTLVPGVPGKEAKQKLPGALAQLAHAVLGKDDKVLKKAASKEEASLARTDAFGKALSFFEREFGGPIPWLPIAVGSGLFGFLLFWYFRQSGAEAVGLFAGSSLEKHPTRVISMSPSIFGMVRDDSPRANSRAGEYYIRWQMRLGKYYLVRVNREGGLTPLGEVLPGSVVGAEALNRQGSGNFKLAGDRRWIPCSEDANVVLKVEHKSA